MTDCLLFVLNAREQLTSERMRSYYRLGDDVCVIRAHYEHAATAAMNEVVASTLYRRYSVISDDCTIPPIAWHKIQAAAALGAPAVTGYCRLDRNDERVNLTDLPLMMHVPSVAAYNWRLLDDVQRWPEPLVQTWFAGNCASTFQREVLLRHEFRAFRDWVNPRGGFYANPDGTMRTFDKGCASDFMLSIALQKAGIEIWAPRDALCEHHKNRWNLADASERLICGREDPQVLFVKA